LTATAVLAFTLALPACNDALGPRPSPGGELGVVLGSVDLSLTIFPVDSPDAARTVGIALAGTPVSLATRNGLAIVPLGTFPAAAVVEVASAQVRSVPLPEGSGATGVAFLDDSIAYVANPGLNTVSRVNVRRGTATNEIEVGGYPQAVVARGGRIYVLQGELDETFRPTRNGRVSVIDPATDSVIATIILTGYNPSAAAFGPDGRLYVVNSGTFGQGDGSLSVADTASLLEVEHHPGFGEFPGDIELSDDGRAFVSSFFYGIAVWDAANDSFIDPPADPLVVEGNTISSGLGFDSAGRLHTLVPGDCTAPGRALRLTPDLSFDREIAVGVCPIAITFTRVAEP
jgi:YVTN family beta-propeller protein